VRVDFRIKPLFTPKRSLFFSLNLHIMVRVTRLRDGANLKKIVAAVSEIIEVEGMTPGPGIGKNHANH